MTLTGPAPGRSPRALVTCVPAASFPPASAARMPPRSLCPGPVLSHPAHMLSPGRPRLGHADTRLCVPGPRFSWCRHSRLLPDATRAEGRQEPGRRPRGSLWAETQRGFLTPRLPEQPSLPSGVCEPVPRSRQVFFERKEENTRFSVTWKTAAAQPRGPTPPRSSRQGVSTDAGPRARHQPSPDPPRLIEIPTAETPSRATVPAGPRQGRQVAGRRPGREAPRPCPPPPPHRALALAGCATWGAGFWGWRAKA